MVQKVLAQNKLDEQVLESDDEIKPIKQLSEIQNISEDDFKFDEEIQAEVIM